MTDDSTLLCGYQRGASLGSNVMGLLTRVDKAGHAVSHRVLYPQGDQSFRLSYLRKCSAWGNGVAAVGSAFRSRQEGGNYVDEHFHWIVALNENGEIRWEKLLPGQGTLEVLVLPNQNLVLSKPYPGGTMLTVLDFTGKIKAQKTIPVGATLIRSTVSSLAIHLLSGASGLTLWTLNENLEEVDRLAGDVTLIRSNATYVLPNRSLVLFGEQREKGVPTATIAKLSSDLKKSATFSFQPLWVSSWVNDALPSGKPGEFLTIRTVHRLPHWPDENRVGLVFAFVRLR